MGRALGDELMRQWLVADDGLISETGGILLAAIDAEIGRAR